MVKVVREFLRVIAMWVLCFNDEVRDETVLLKKCKKARLLPFKKET